MGGYGNQILYINMCKIEPGIFIHSTNIYVPDTGDVKAKKISSLEELLVLWARYTNKY